jgi:hypothetical protein
MYSARDQASHPLVPEVHFDKGNLTLSIQLLLVSGCIANVLYRDLSYSLKGIFYQKPLWLYTSTEHLKLVYTVLAIGQFLNNIFWGK